MYQVDIESISQKIEIQNDQNGFQLNGYLFEGDIQVIRPGLFHIIHQHKAFTVEVIEVNYAEKVFVISINNKVTTLRVRDRFDILLAKMGMSDINAVKINQVKAPMPGLILEVKVAEQTSVQKGDPLLILEAMKMENVIKSPVEAVIKELKIVKGDSVEKGQVLIVFE
ncbi:MAG: acetyl-CoA carboxylase biotin carboxyl carrier protein subunit [Thermonemataceae bacterium]